MPREATSGARSSLGESRVPRDAAALVAAAARLRGALSDAEAARVGTAEILALLRAPRDADAPSPRRLRARCGWALDHGVVDALVEAMRAHADCVPVQTLAATCLADVAEAFVGDAEAGVGAPERRGRERRRSEDEEEALGLDFVFQRKAPRRVPFDASSGAVTRAEACVDAFDALRALKESRRRQTAKTTSDDEDVSSNQTDCSYDEDVSLRDPETSHLVSFLTTNLAHAPVFRDVDLPTRRALVGAATAFRARAGEPAFPGRDEETDCAYAAGSNTRASTDRTLVLFGEALAKPRRDRGVSRAPAGFDAAALSTAASDSASDLRSPLLSAEDFLLKNRKTHAGARTETNADATRSDAAVRPKRPKSQTAKRRHRFVAGDALDEASDPDAYGSDLSDGSDGSSPRSFVAGAEGCALVVVPGWALEASAIASAVDDGLRGFFGAGPLEEAADAEREREPPRSSRGETLPHANARDVRAFHESNFFPRIEKKSAGAFDSPHARLARDGAADAVLHVALRCAGAPSEASSVTHENDDFFGNEKGHSGGRRTKIALASACFSFLERLASPPCDDATRKRLGADGAMDRVVATKAFLISFSSLSNAFERDTKEERDTEEEREIQMALDAADRALRALARCEQNMRAAFSLGAAEIVW